MTIKAGSLDDAIRVPPICEDHEYSLIREELNLTPNDPWRAALVIANILLFQKATQLFKYDSILDVEHWGCLACKSPEAAEATIIILKKGLDHAAKVSRGLIYDPDFKLDLRPKAE